MGLYQAAQIAEDRVESVVDSASDDLEPNDYLDQVVQNMGLTREAVFQLGQKRLAEVGQRSLLAFLGQQEGDASFKEAMEKDSAATQAIVDFARQYSGRLVTVTALGTDEEPILSVSNIGNRIATPVDATVVTGILTARFDWWPISIASDSLVLARPSRRFMPGPFSHYEIEIFNSRTREPQVALTVHDE